VYRLARVDRVPARLNMIVPVNEYIEKMTEALELLILPRQSEKNTLQEILAWGVLWPTLRLKKRVHGGKSTYVQSQSFCRTFGVRVAQRYASLRCGHGCFGCGWHTF
ncbi:MAG: hypothetical protein WAK39_16315, partial [Pseudolabrys sp.]